jgi:hypothetical protein
MGAFRSSQYFKGDYYMCRSIGELPIIRYSRFPPAEFDKISGAPIQCRKLSLNDVPDDESSDRYYGHIWWFYTAKKTVL